MKRRVMGKSEISSDRKQLLCRLHLNESDGGWHQDFFCANRRISHLVIMEICVVSTYVEELT